MAKYTADTTLVHGAGIVGRSMIPQPMTGLDPLIKGALKKGEEALKKREELDAKLDKNVEDILAKATSLGKNYYDYVYEETKNYKNDMLYAMRKKDKKAQSDASFLVQDLAIEVQDMNQLGLDYAEMYKNGEMSDANFVNNALEGKQLEKFLAKDYTISKNDAGQRVYQMEIDGKKYDLTRDDYSKLVIPKHYKTNTSYTSMLTNQLKSQNFDATTARSGVYKTIGNYDLRTYRGMMAEGIDGVSFDRILRNNISKEDIQAAINSGDTELLQKYKKFDTGGKTETKVTEEFTPDELVESEKKPATAAQGIFVTPDLQDVKKEYSPITPGQFTTKKEEIVSGDGIISDEEYDNFIDAITNHENEFFELDRNKNIVADALTTNASKSHEQRWASVETQQRKQRGTLRVNYGGNFPQYIEYSEAEAFVNDMKAKKERIFSPNNKSYILNEAGTAYQLNEGDKKTVMTNENILVDAQLWQKGGEFRVEEFDKSTIPTIVELNKEDDGGGGGGDGGVNPPGAVYGANNNKLEKLMKSKATPETINKLNNLYSKKYKVKFEAVPSVTGASVKVKMIGSDGTEKTVTLNRSYRWAVARNQIVDFVSKYK